MPRTPTLMLRLTDRPKGRSTQNRRARRQGAIGDVEVDAPPIAPVDLDEGQPAIEAEAEPADEAAEDIETYAARRERRAAKGRPWRWPLSRLQSGVLALLIVDAIIVGWRDEFRAHHAADRLVLFDARSEREPARPRIR